MTAPYSNDALEEALARTDVAAIGAALRTGRVAVPLLDDSQVRVFPGEDGAGPPYELMLFSSVDTLGLFLADDPNRLARWQDADEMRTFLAAHRGQIDHVIFDPAGPHPVRTELVRLLGVIGPRAYVDLRLPKGQEWYPVDLSSDDVRDYQLAGLRQKVLPQVQRDRTEEIAWAGWMTAAAEEASERGATSLAFWLQRVARRPAGLALSLGRPLPAGARHRMHLGVAGGYGPASGERWVSSPDRTYETRLAYSFPSPDLADTVLTTVELVVATLAWGDE